MASKQVINIKRQLLSLALLAVMLLLPVFPLFASIDNADYLGPITVTNNSTATANVSTVMTLNSAGLISNFGVANNFSDVVIRDSNGSDVAFMPSVNTTYPWALWVDSIAANSAQNMGFYLKDVSDGKIRYFPGAGGMTSTDDDTDFEPSSNFTIEQKGYLDTTAGASKYLVNKPSDASYGGMQVFVDPSTSGTVTARIMTLTASTTINILANAAGDNTSLTPNTGTNYQAIDDSVGAADNATTYVSWNTSTYTQDSYNYATPSYLGNNQQILGVKVYYDFTSNGGGTAYAKPLLRLSGVQTTGTEQSTAGTTWLIKNETLARPGGGSWSLADIIALQAGVQLKTSGTGLSECTQVYLEITYSYETNTDVSATDVSSADTTLTVTGTANYPSWATGSVLNFDGTATSYVDFGNIYSSQAVFGLSFWFKPVANYTAGDPTQRLFGKWDGVADNYYWISLDGGNLGQLRLDADCLDPGSITIKSTETSWTAGVWYHAYIELNSTGSPKATIRINGGIPVTTDVVAIHMPTNSKFVMGNMTTPGASGFKGQIMNVIAVTSAMSDAQQLALYAGTAPAGMAEYWYTDEGTGNSVYSYGTTATTGTKGAGATWGTATYTSGQTGRLCDFWISDGTVRFGKNLKGVSVPNNGNGWTFLSGASEANLPMPYLEYQKIYIGGQLRQHIYWQYLTTFVDQSSFSNSAVPTFRTASSDSDVSAALTSLQPVAQAVSSASPSLSWPAILATPPPQPSTTYTENSTTSGYPGFFFAPVIHAILQTQTAIPESFFWYSFCFFIIIAAGMVAFALHPSLILKVSVTTALMVLFAAEGINVYGGYVVLYFVFFCFGVIVVRENTYR